MEPGDAKLERARHDEFIDERRQGEWFSCSPRLTTHVFRTWKRNNLLPKEHQMEVLALQDRIDHYMAVRQVIGGPPDLVNPSLADPWQGTVLVDLVHAIPLGVPRHTGRGKRKGPRE
jgi:hypothetical protein